VIRCVPQSRTAKLFLPLFKIIAWLTKPFNYKGVGTLSRYAGKIFPLAPVIIYLNKHSKIEIDLFDYYWSRLIDIGFAYEPEIESFIKQNISDDCVFIDCGANIGYWSILVSERLPKNRVLAIEASSETHPKTLKNNQLNGYRFFVKQAAICEVPDKLISFTTPDGHASAHIKLDGEVTKQSDEVITTTIDSVFDEYFPDFSGTVIIKLDVEGAEIDAIKGAKNILSLKRVIVIYEDHGADITCSVSEYIMEHLNFNIFFLGDRPEKITSIEQIKERKTNQSVGYNLVATNMEISPI